MKYFTLFFTLGCLVSCQQKITPEAPKESYLKGAESLTKEISYLNMPLEINLGDVQRQINHNLSDELYKDDSYNDNNEDGLKLLVLKKGDFKIYQAVNDLFSFEIPIKIVADKQVGVFGFNKSAKTDFEMKIKFTSKFFIDADWKLNSITNAEGFDFLTEPSINIGGIAIPLKSIVSRIIANYQPMIARQIDGKVREMIDISAQVLPVWNSLKEPIQVSEEYNTWLIIEPQDMLMTPLKTTNNQLFFNVVMKAYVETYSGTKSFEKAKPSTTLPPLKFVNSAPSGFKINAQNILSYKEAETIAQREFNGKTFSFKKEKYNITISNIELYGADEKMVIKTKVSGDLDAVVYLTGVPVLNYESNIIEMQNLHFDLKTKNILAKSASWILEGILEKEIAKSLQYPVNELLQSLKQEMEGSLNKELLKGVKLNTKVLKIVPKQVILTEEGILSQFSTVGNIKLKIDGL